MEYQGKKLNEISFPLGGIGTGSIGIDGTGRLIDWEIFNHPDKGSYNGRSHVAIRTIDGDKITARVLNGTYAKNYMGQYQRGGGLHQHSGYGYGPFNDLMGGFPHFKNVKFNGEFPIAIINFSDETFPAAINMTAFNPFIPNDSFNSSIPAAFFEFEIENVTQKPLKYQIAFSVANPFDKSVNKSQIISGYKSVTLKNNAVSETDLKYADLTIATDCEKSYNQTYWYRGSWCDSIVTFWNEFTQKINIDDRVYEVEGRRDVCSLVAEVDVLPGEKGKVKFVLSWNAPNANKYWSETGDEADLKPWKNYYATVFENSKKSAEYSLKNYGDLYSRTLKFKNALHSTSLPKEFIDAASANLAVLKSPTVLRLEDGSLYGWEGVSELMGSCEGTCQHVWNYAYAACFLFPDLERSIRDLEFKYSTTDDGKMGFRMLLPVGSGVSGFRACLDGQMGAVIKCYREWKISGDNEWLKNNWNDIKKVLEYAWSPSNPDAWDLNKDGVLEGRQHHTLDAELFGPSSWLEGMYLAALKAASEMAEFLGDTAKASEYRDLFNKGYEFSKNNLFNGKYFIQKVDLSDKSIIDRFDKASEWYWNDETKQIKYQIGDGSSIDQLLAQWHASLVGLGDIFDKNQVKIALGEMMKNNFKPKMSDFTNPWRLFSINDEAGTVICDYPDGSDKPFIPIPYCEETMTGFEYSFAGLLCAYGMIDDGLKVVKAVRDRFDGEKRNPWNEFECGSNYARSMASFALIPILSGFKFDMPNNFIAFNPYVKNKYQSVWSIGGAWGNFELDGNVVKISVYEGELNLKSIGLEFADKCSDVKIDGKAVDFNFDNGVVTFNKTDIKNTVEITL